MPTEDPCSECGAPAPFHKTTCSKGGPQPKRQFPMFRVGRQVPTGMPSKSFLTQFVERGKKCPSCVMLRGPEAISVAKMALAGLDAKELGDRLAVAVEGLYGANSACQPECTCNDCNARRALADWRAKHPKLPTTGGTAA